MKTFVFTPPDETSIIETHIVPFARSHDTRLECESSWWKTPFGSQIFSGRFRSRGIVYAVTGRAAFLFRGNFKGHFSGTPSAVQPRQF
jgi:hypothetical protein